MSALLNGRSQAKALPATDHVRFPCRSPAVTSGSADASAATSSSVTMSERYSRRPGLGDLPNMLSIRYRSRIRLRRAAVPLTGRATVEVAPRTDADVSLRDLDE